MNWHDIAMNPQAIASLYEQLPALTQVRVLEAILKQDGPALLLRLDLREYPQHPPERWIRQGFNVAQVELDFFAIERLELSGWTTNNILDFEVRREAPRVIVVNARGAGCSIAFRCGLLRIARVQGYRDSSQAPAAPH